MTPKPSLTPAALRVLAALLSCPRPPTIRELMQMLGYASPRSIQLYLFRLRRLGLVSWETGRCATLRATCCFIPADQLGDDR